MRREKGLCAQTNTHARPAGDPKIKTRICWSSIVLFPSSRTIARLSGGRRHFLCAGWARFLLRCLIVELRPRLAPFGSYRTTADCCVSVRDDTTTFTFLLYRVLPRDRRRLWPRLRSERQDTRHRIYANPQGIEPWPALRGPTTPTIDQYKPFRGKFDSPG